MLDKYKSRAVQNFSASSLPGFQREMRCAAKRMDARRGAQPMALPLVRVATHQTPFRPTSFRKALSFAAHHDVGGRHFHVILETIGSVATDQIVDGSIALVAGDSNHL